MNVSPAIAASRRPSRPRPTRRRRAAAESLPAEDGEEDREVLFALLAPCLGCMAAAEAAEALLGRFAGLTEVLGAPLPELAAMRELGEGGAAALKAAQAAAQRLERLRASRPALRGTAALLAYLRRAEPLGEGLRALFLDARDRLIADEPVAGGAPGRALRRALALRAEGLLLVRARASGDPTAAEADIALARSLEQAAQVMEIRLVDVVVMGRGAPASLRAAGLIGAVPGRA